MKKDGVAAAFELIVEEIEAVAAEIADQGSTAFREKAYEVAQRLSESGKNLQDFRTKVDDLLEEWRSGIDVDTRQRFRARRAKISKVRVQKPKAPRTRLRVVFGDGRTIEEDSGADTFALALRKVGLSRVEGLGVTVRKMALVGNTRSERYGQRRIDGQYILTHSSTPEKKTILEQVGKRLGVNLRVELV